VPYGTQLGDGLRLLDAGEIVKAPRRLQGGDSIQFLDGRAPGEIRLTSAPDWLLGSTKDGQEPLFEQGEVRLKDVLTPHGHDEAEDEVVSSIAESPIGPFNPILVRRIPGDKDGKVELIAGKQRLEAARIRGMETIKCQFFTGNDTTARIIRIEEDLFRKESSVLRRAERLVEWAELIQKTGYRISGQVVRKKRGRPPKLLYRRLRELPAVGRTPEARRQTFRRASKIAAISQEAKAISSAGGLDYNQDALLAIAKAGPAKAVKKAKELVSKLQERMQETTNTPPSRVAAAKAQRGGVHKSPPPQPDSNQHDDQGSDGEPASPPVPKETTLDDLNDFWKRGGPKLWRYASFAVRTKFKEKLDRAPYAAKSDVVEFIKKVFAGRRHVNVQQLYAYAKVNGIRKKALAVNLRALGHRLSKLGSASAAPCVYINGDRDWKERLIAISDAELQAPLAAEQNATSVEQQDELSGADSPQKDYYANI
jgi:ParB-like chromosome segregation protein Spo0J